MNRLQCSKAHRNRTVPDQARLPGLRGPARRSPPPAHTRATEKSISSTPTCVSSSRWRAPGMPGRLSPAQVSREGSLPEAAAARRRGRGLGRRGGPRGAPPRAPRTPPPRPRPTPRRPARPRGGEAAGAGPASASGAAARGRRRSEARRAAEAGGGRGLRLLLLLLLLRRRPWLARWVGIGMGRGVRGPRSRSRLGGGCDRNRSRRVRRAPRGGSGWPRNCYHLFADAYEICDLNIVHFLSAPF